MLSKIIIVNLRENSFNELLTTSFHSVLPAYLQNMIFVLVSWLHSENLRGSTCCVCNSLVAAYDYPVSYRKNPNISQTLVSNNFVSHSDANRASRVGAASTASSFST